MPPYLPRVKGRRALPALVCSQARPGECFLSASFSLSRETTGTVMLLSGSTGHKCNPREEGEAVRYEM